jgi:hypothetical protein
MFAEGMNSYMILDSFEHSKFYGKIHPELILHRLNLEAMGNEIDQALYESAHIVEPDDPKPTSDTWNAFPVTIPQQPINYLVQFITSGEAPTHLEYNEPAVKHIPSEREEVRGYLRYHQDRSQSFNFLDALRGKLDPSTTME